MDKKKKEAIMRAATFDELLDAEYGKPGSSEREQFDTEAVAFSLAENGRNGDCRGGGVNPAGA